MPGETPSLAEKSRTPVWRWNSRCISRRTSIFAQVRPHAPHLVGVDQVVLEDGELRRGLDR